MALNEKKDNIQIEILEDGTIKVLTDPISGANHQNAEQFLQFMGRLAGGETTRARRQDAQPDVLQAHHHHVKH